MAKRSSFQELNSVRTSVVQALDDIFVKRSFSGHLLDRTLSQSQLSSLDRGLFTELFYGYLRFGHRLEFIIDQLLSQPTKTPKLAKLILGVALYQKLYLNKIPDHALANEAVMSAKFFYGKSPMVGVINAVLQNFLRSPKIDFLETGPLGPKLSLPSWLAGRWKRQWGESELTTLAEALNSRSPTHLRVNLIRATKQSVQDQLQVVGAVVEQADSPAGLILKSSPSSPEALPGFRDGEWSIQNLASQKIAPLLEPQAGEQILDACAGFGGKTLHLAELTGDQAKIEFHDLIPEKQTALLTRAQQTGFKNVQPAADLSKIYDKVLIDAPCSGLGTLASHPEIKWSRTLESVAHCVSRQNEVLADYSQRVRPGGKLLYAVCSIDREEGDGVVEAFLTSHPSFVQDTTFAPSGMRSDGLGFYLWPTVQGETGYYVARLTRTH